MEYESGALERPEDVEKDAPGVVRRWMLELKLSDKREDKWREKGAKVLKRYRQDEARKHSFNILWSNTETLKPAVYNTLPSPDVRRRFKDEDPIGKAVSEVLGRALEYGLDVAGFHEQIQSTVLDMLLPGRGVARVRYVPSLVQVDVTAETHDEEAEKHADGEESLDGDCEELEWEQAPVEHVQWDDFRMGPGKEWGEIPWIAFRHRLTRDKLEDQFPDCGAEVQLDNTDDEDIKNADEADKEAFKTAEVWEIWDKDETQVLFVAKGYKSGPLKTLPDPLKLIQFFPVPRPLYAIADPTSLVPVPLFELYREQADELDAITRRINILTRGLKLRGIYDSTIKELSELMRGEDNDLIPASNVTALIERGGLEKAIWFMPIEQAAQVLKVLLQAREVAKQTVYEITGISDILRGSSNANETATAQQIKANWGSGRLKGMQAEVARFIRDLLRLQAEIIGERFQPETLATMTGLKFPTGQEKQQMVMQQQMAQQQAQMAAQQPQQPGQPPMPQQAPQAPQQPLPPSWDEIIQIMRDDKLRTFKIDVEADSTVAASVEADMAGLKDVLGAVNQVMQGFGPAVQMGALPVDALKELIMTVVRRAKLGNAVEDAFDKMKQPTPPANPEAGKAQAEMQKAQMAQQAKAQELQANQQMELQRLGMERQAEQARLQAEMQLEQFREHLVSEREQRQGERDMMLAQQTAQMEMMFQKWKAELDASTKIEVAEIGAQTTLTTAQINAAQAADSVADTSEGETDAHL